MITPSPRRRNGESGYAMLLVFLMAAMIAIMLYKELPRVAFEKQRAKEQLLIERGEQYKRAIQLFVRKMGRYPATVEELENTNNIRFLRKRYVDPMTGKDKWRLIHVNGGVLTDSIIQKNKPGQDQPQQANTNTFIGEGPVLGATNDPSQQQINPALRRRPSDDRPVAPQPQPQQVQEDGDQEVPVVEPNDSDEAPVPGTPGAAANGDPQGAAQGNLPGRFQPNTFPPGVNPNQPGMANQGMVNPGMANGGMPNGGMPNGGMPNQPYPNGAMGNQMQNGGMGGPGGTDASGSSGSVYVAPSLGQSPAPMQLQLQPQMPGQMPNSPGPGPGGQFPNRPGFPGQPGAFPGQAGAFGQQGGAFGQQGGAFGQQAGAFGQQPGGFGQQAQMGAAAGDPSQGNGGAGGLNNLGLTSPRPGGMQGLPGMSGTQMGGGIAGVASESTGPSIIVYNERKKYNEWEFVYDQSKDRGLAGVQRGGGAPGTPAGQMGSMPPGIGGQQPGMGGMGGPGGNTVSNGIFGNSGFGGQQSPGFGQQQPGFGQPGPQQPQQPQPPQQPPN